MRAKKRFNKIKYKDGLYGYRQRESYYKNIMDGNKIFPEPLEYSDIDDSFIEFVKNKIPIVYDGKNVDTFKLFSNQRFSEYTQTWNHTDDEGNLLMNFKTVNRDTNPSRGSNQGNLANIPGDRKYTLLIRDVLDENGTESYEIYSMKQPLCVDLTYYINFITNSFDKINEFNTIINDLFKSIQCYIFPNGHSIPMKLESINDNTSYTIDDRKFYVQKVQITAMAYIIKRSDFTVEKKTKRKDILTDKNNIPKNSVEIEEYEDNVTIGMNFMPSSKKIEFNFDDNVIIHDIKSENVRSFKLKVNDNEIDTSDIFNISCFDNVKIHINQFEFDKSSYVKFTGKKISSI